jgi:large subunit ribosomal protein L24
MATNKCHLKKDDKVKVIAGKDKGKVGKILRVDRDKNRILVENINVLKHHVKPNPQQRQGGIVERESTIHLSNAMLMCDKCLTPTRIKMKRLEDGKKVRICVKCDEHLDS